MKSCIRYEVNVLEWGTHSIVFRRHCYYYSFSSALSAATITTKLMLVVVVHSQQFLHDVGCNTFIFIC